jgi:hypothetical protein
MPLCLSRLNDLAALLTRRSLLATLLYWSCNPVRMALRRSFDADIRQSCMTGTAVPQHTHDNLKYSGR